MFFFFICPPAHILSRWPHQQGLDHEPGASFGSLKQLVGVQVLGPSSATFPNWELDQKSSSQDTKQHLYRMLAEWAVALPNMAQHQSLVWFLNGPMESP